MSWIQALGSAIQATASHINAGIGYLGQKKAADKYYQGVKETNEQNYKIWQEQMAHEQNMYDQEVENNRADATMSYNRQIDMWEREMAYNTPAAQRRRLEAAGLNAANILGNASNGSVTSAPGSAPQAQSASHTLPQAPTMQAPQMVTSPEVVAMQIANQSLDSVGNLFNGLSQRQLNTQNIKNLGLSFDLQNTFGRELLGLDVKDRTEQSRWLPHFLSTQWNMAEDQRLSLQANTRLLQLSGDEKAILNSYADQYQQQGLVEQLYKIENMRKSGLLTDKQIDTLEQFIRESEARTYKTWLEANGVKLDNTTKNAYIQVFNRTMNSIINKIRFDASLSGMNLGLAQQQYGFNEKHNPWLLKNTMFDVLKKEQNYDWFPYQQIWNGFIEGGNTSANIYGAVAGGRRR